MVKKKGVGKKSSGFLRWMLVFLVFCGAVTGVAAYGIFEVLPQSDPGNQFTRENIQSILSGETRVFYRDGKTLHGAFFDANHRVYVPYDQIPPSIVNALVAAEDANYFKHHGFDLKGFLRAVVVNVRAGAMVQGGSTLTQQTAKNIFGRDEKSVSEKFEELINALKLEKRFSKQEILEFYLNQFYVAGTGRGVSIAAWHFFSKDLSQLSLAECAFIAGSVKGPAKYDPFMQRTQKGRDKCLAAAQVRVEYVLRRMLEDGYITQQQCDQALKKPLNFQMGQFRFALTTSMERIEEKLNSPFYRNLFDSLKIDSWQKAQLKIITTLDAQTDLSASVALQENLADLQMKLGGFVFPKGVRPDNVQRMKVGEYLYGSVDSVDQGGGALRAIILRFGVARGVITTAELDTFAVRHHSNPKQALAKVLKKGSVLLVRVVNPQGPNGMAVLRLETEPVVQGAMVALENGAIIASQGGFHNTGYDRVNRAVRQFGSSWKPLLYATAFQLGWHYMDSLENTWNLFQLGDRFYFPHPDHVDRGARVSIAWAAARSENIASIWLLDHLLDRLDPDQMRAVAVANGFLARDGEDTEAWKARLRDSLGLIMNDETKAEIRFIQARDKIVGQLMASGEPGKAWVLAQLPYGRGAVDAEPEQIKAKSPENIPLLRYNYKALRVVVEKRIAQESFWSFLPSLESVMIRDPLSLADFLKVESLLQAPPEEGDYFADQSKLFAWPDFRRQLAMAEFVRFAGVLGIHQVLQPVQSMPLGTNDVTLVELSTAYQSLFSGKSWRCADGVWNEPCLIREIRDAKNKVLFSNIPQSREVMSAAATQQMAVILRETFESGTARSGLESMALRSPESGVGLLVPVAGKTGTTNDYRNVAFLGALPTWDAGVNAFRLDAPVTIGSYVGFDDNRALQVKGLRIAGATGALPQWAELAKDVFVSRKDAEHVDFLDLALVSSGMVPWYLPLRDGADLQVDPKTGIELEGEDATSSTSIPRLRF